MPDLLLLIDVANLVVGCVLGLIGGIIFSHYKTKGQIAALETAHKQSIKTHSHDVDSIRETIRADREAIREEIKTIMREAEAVAYEAKKACSASMLELKRSNDDRDEIRQAVRDNTEKLVEHGAAIQRHTDDINELHAMHEKIDFIAECMRGLVKG